MAPALSAVAGSRERYRLLMRSCANSAACQALLRRSGTCEHDRQKENDFKHNHQNETMSGTGERRLEIHSIVPNPKRNSKIS